MVQETSQVKAVGASALTRNQLVTTLLVASSQGQSSLWQHRQIEKREWQNPLSSLAINNLKYLAILAHAESK
jgi:hypothetical protein